MAFSAKNGEDLANTSKVIILNVWSHLIWPTLYARISAGADILLQCLCTFIRNIAFC